MSNFDENTPFNKQKNDIIIKDIVYNFVQKEILKKTKNLLIILNQYAKIRKHQLYLCRNGGISHQRFSQKFYFLESMRREQTVLS